MAYTRALTNAIRRVQAQAEEQTEPAAELAAP
jgi:hypothetical protein